MTLVKICGLTHPDDACQALEAGADLLGMVFAPGPRRIDLTVADRLRAVTAEGARRVGVFVDPDPVFVEEAIVAGGLDLVQLHGEESPALCATPSRPVIKALRVGRDRIAECLERYQVDYLLVDTYVAGAAGGTGQTFAWAPARDWASRRRLFLAGGLTPENVARAIRVVRPYAVDVSSGVERAPGRKDADRVERFIAAVRATRADAEAQRAPSSREEG